MLYGFIIPVGVIILANALVKEVYLYFSCWLSFNPMRYGFIIPVGVIILANAIVKEVYLSLFQLLVEF